MTVFNPATMRKVVTASLTFVLNEAGFWAVSAKSFTSRIASPRSVLPLPEGSWRHMFRLSHELMSMGRSNMARNRFIDNACLSQSTQSLRVSLRRIPERGILLKRLSRLAGLDKNKQRLCALCVSVVNGTGANKKAGLPSRLRQSGYPVALGPVIFPAGGNSTQQACFAFHWEAGAPRSPGVWLF